MFEPILNSILRLVLRAFPRRWRVLRGDHRLEAMRRRCFDARYQVRSWVGFVLVSTGAMAAVIIGGCLEGWRERFATRPPLRRRLEYRWTHRSIAPNWDDWADDDLTSRVVSARLIAGAVLPLVVALALLDPAKTQAVLTGGSYPLATILVYLPLFAVVRPLRVRQFRRIGADRSLDDPVLDDPVLDDPAANEPESLRVAAGVGAGHDGGRGTRAS